MDDRFGGDPLLARMGEPAEILHRLLVLAAEAWAEGESDDHLYATLLARAAGELSDALAIAIVRDHGSNPRPAP